MALPWIILFTPLVAVVVILLLTRRSRDLSAYVSVGAVAVTFVASCLLFLQANPTGPNRMKWIDLDPAKLLPSLDAALGNPAAQAPGFIPFDEENGALVLDRRVPANQPRLSIPFGVTVDALSKTMLLVVTGVGLLVHVYSLGYMQEDAGKSRYFAGLSLFMFSMLGIVLADNFLMMFIFWELVGLSSYLLIGHWFERPQAVDAANKAFLVNRIGDFGFMLGILMVWALTGTLIFADAQSAVGRLAGDPATAGYLTVAALLVFMGPMGKSAQVPLHVWLPDAMEGPTPVSALIHAATMVAAGVYLLVRVGFLVVAAPLAGDVIAWVGIITAVLAALMATQQDDIKRILAYSTLSQLGYMICAVGLLAGGAAMFHLFTHAFFKALLFLGAGSVIYAMHHEQDIWKMGGLRGKMPTTFLTFAIGTAALTGFPLLSGFWSKDAILAEMQAKNPVIFLLGIFTAFLTAFYMTRLFVVVFLNRPAKESEEAVAHAHEPPGVMTLPLIVLAVPSVFAGFGFVAKFFALGEHAAVTPGEQIHHATWVPVLATVVFFVGVGLGFVLYRGKTSDPVRVGLLQHKFYFDEFYAVLVRGTQDALAKASAWFDRWVIDGLGVRGLSGATFGAGFVLRFLQVGNLQAYAFFFAVGVLAIVYLALLS